MRDDNDFWLTLFLGTKKEYVWDRSTLPMMTAYDIDVCKIAVIIIAKVDGWISFIFEIR